MPTFRSKPLEIEAVQIRWSNWSDICAFVGNPLKESGAFEVQEDEVSDTCGEPGPTYIAFWAETTHGERAMFRHGDWIIPDSRPGTFYPCKPDIFAAKYELVEE